MSNSKKSKVRPIIATVMLVNALSSLVFSELMARCADSLSVERLPEEGQTMNYFVAGVFNQPKDAFEFMRPLIPTSDGVAYCNYHTYGTNFCKMAEDIKSDIRKQEYTRARIFVISVGDIVCQKLAEDYAADPEVFGETEVEFIEINPCGRTEFLKDNLHGTLAPLSVAATLADRCLLGWLGHIPLLHVSYHWSSVRHGSDLFRCIIYGEEGTLSGGATTLGLTKAVITSSDDEFLDNDVIELYFGDEKVVGINAKHADTIDGWQQYQDAMAEILRN